MKYHYITIEREYGSAGTEIGKKTAERAGVSCCTSEVYEKVAARLGMSAKEGERREESTTNSFLYSIAMLINAQSGKSDTLSTEQQIYLSMQRAVKEAAEQGRCVFVGHCAGEALRDRGGVLRVFIRADYESKKDRIIKEYGVDKGSVDKVMEKNNRRRRSAYYANTMKKWDAAENYDMVLDSGKLGVETCVQILSGLLL